MCPKSYFRTRMKHQCVTINLRTDGVWQSRIHLEKLKSQG